MHSSCPKEALAFTMSKQRDSVLDPHQTVRRLRHLQEWKARLSQSWLGESEMRSAPILLGRLASTQELHADTSNGEWFVVVLEPDADAVPIGPFASLEEAITYGVREHTVHAWHRVESVDEYVGRHGLRHTQAAQSYLEMFASVPYDPEQVPDADWLLRSEEDRLSSIRLYHRAHPKPTQPAEDGPRHAWLHFWGETALCANLEPAFAEAFGAWIAVGLSRHEAIHALGECIAAQLDDARKGHVSDIEEYLVAIDPRHFRQRTS